MDSSHVDFDAVIGAWHGAFEAADAALRAAGRDHDLPAGELQRRSRELTSERAATVNVLGDLAREWHARPGLVRLLASPREAKKLLGLPADVAACIFNVDGVLVASAAIHADVWKRTFDEFIFRRIDRTGGTFATFSRRVDYPAVAHGRSGMEAVRAFLASRGISLPEGQPDDPPTAETVFGLANAKSRDSGGVPRATGCQCLRRRPPLSRTGPRCRHPVRRRLGQYPHPDPARSCRSDPADRRMRRRKRDRGEHGLRRKPAPDMLLAACDSLDARPEQTAVFETTEDGVIAGRAAGCEFVVAVDQEGHAKSLLARGADRVVTDLGEILEHALG